MNRYKKSFYFAKDLVKSLRIYIVIFSCVIVAGIAIGIVTGFKIQSSLTEAEANARILTSLFYGTNKTFFMFLNAILQTCFFTVIIFACNLHIFAVPINHLFLLYRGYVFGLNIVILIFNVGFTGIVFVIAVFIPIQLILLIFLIIKSSVLNNLCVLSRRTGSTPLKHYGFNTSFNHVLIVCAGSLAIRIIEFILMLIFSQNLLLTIGI